MPRQGPRGVGWFMGSPFPFLFFSSLLTLEMGCTSSFSFSYEYVWLLWLWLWLRFIRGECWWMMDDSNWNSCSRFGCLNASFRLLKRCRFVESNEWQWMNITHDYNFKLHYGIEYEYCTQFRSLFVSITITITSLAISIRPSYKLKVLSSTSLDHSLILLIAHAHTSNLNLAHI